MSMRAPVTIDELLPALIISVEEDRKFEIALKEWKKEFWAVDPEEVKIPVPVKPRGPVLTSAAMLEIVNEIIRLRSVA